jgi:hypothetical protein
VNSMFNEASFGESMFMDMNVLETIDEIAVELFQIEESAMLALGIITQDDQLLEELNFPVVSDLLHVPVEG